MSGKKNNRQQQRRQQAARQARARAAAARQQREQKKKRNVVVAFAAIGLVAVLLLGVALNSSKDSGKATDVSSTASTKPEPKDSTDPTEPRGESAKGRPCVAPTGKLPDGAPAVPVKVGPPPTSLVVEDLKPGTGAEVPKGGTVTVNYIGVSCSNGKVFDSSWERKEPATFPLSGVIKGWTDGIPGMKVGGQRLLGIPGDLAYGPAGRPPDILGDETLWFVIDLVSVS